MTAARGEPRRAAGVAAARADAPRGAAASLAPRAAEGPAWAHAALLAVAFAGLLASTWGRWPDVVVDFGRELYVPWRMLEGDRLFRDISWFNGPLSPSWNALAFRLFGVGLATLVWVDVALFACVLALLHALLREFTSRAAATAACLVVMAACGFGQAIFIGNYNFVCPYSHEATHGVLLGLAALAAAHRAGKSGGAAAAGWALASGLAVGLAFLTKPEMLAAALAGALAALLLHALRRRRAAPGVAAAFAAGAVLPVAASFAALRGALGDAGAWTATLGAWPQLAATDVSQQRFYLAGMGLDRPGTQLAATLRWGAAALAVLAPGALLAVLAPARARVAAAVLAVAATAALCALLYGGLHWLQAPRPWPLFAALACAFAARRALAPGADAAWAGAAAFSAFALAMTAKMLLNARLYHYGFALGLPATALVAAVAWSALPAWLARHGGSAAVARAGVATALAAFAGAHLAQTARFHAAKTVEVGSGRDRFLADARGEEVNAALAWLAERHPPGTPRPTLAVLPEGVTLNYLARVRNPTPYYNFMPPEMVLFEEGRIVEAFRASPPDVVLLVHKDTSEYGVRFFGRHYARRLGGWLRESYREVARFGDAPLRAGSRFGIDALERSARAAQARARVPGALADAGAADAPR